MLEESNSIARELGMGPLMVRSNERLDLLLSSNPMTGYPKGLSHREAEVLRHIAMGETNREIAEALIISLNTVANHVRSILTKTETANRAEAAAFAMRHDLVDL